MMGFRKLKAITTLMELTMSQASPAKQQCPKCKLTLPTDYKEPHCPSCNAQLVKMDAARQAAKTDPDKNAKGNVTMLRFFAAMNLIGGLIGGFSLMSSSVPLGVALILEGG